MRREKNNMGNFVINGTLTIKELYELAKQEGFENRYLFFSIKNKTTGFHTSTHDVIDFGKGWTRASAIINIEIEDEPKTDADYNQPK